MLIKYEPLRKSLNNLVEMKDKSEYLKALEYCADIIVALEKGVKVHGEKLMVQEFFEDLHKKIKENFERFNEIHDELEDISK